MKVVFLGTPEFALNVLEGIYESHHEVVAVVCQPSKPVGRGGKVVDPPTKVFADAHGIPCFQFSKISKEGVDDLKSLDADIMVTAAYGQILSKEVLEITPNGVINVHASLLPNYRGSSPIQWAILCGEKKTGVTIMRTNVGIDDGDMLLQEECGIGEEDTDETMFEKLSHIGSRLIVEALDLIETGKAKFVPQGEKFTYFPMIKKEMAKIDFDKTAKEIDQLVRAFNTWPVAHFEACGQVFKVYKTKPLNGEFAGENGQVVASSSKAGLVIKCKGGAIEIVEMQAPNSKRMLARSYLNGKKIDVGTKVC